MTSATDLTILCVSRFGDHAERFIREMDMLASDLDARFVLGADVGLLGPVAVPRWVEGGALSHLIFLTSGGYIESVLDDVIAKCDEGYILRLDDDETVSDSMREWIAAGEYRAADHWAFPRMHLWPDEQHYLTNPPLYPDLQTRLSVKSKSGGRTRVHQGSPHGTGRIVHVPILHHKFLARPLAEREALLEQYENIAPGAGSMFEAFSVPERFEDQLRTHPVTA